MSAEPFVPETDRGFTALLLAANPDLRKDFAAWRFRPGMGFGEWQKWWQPLQGCRATAHEGLDLLTYSTKTGTEGRLTAGVRIPALNRGVIVKITPDFLGQTMIIAADSCEASSLRLVTFYAHLVPLEGLTVGVKVMAGDLLGVLPAVSPRADSCPPHLHLSMVLAHQNLELARFRWADFHPAAEFKPCDPQSFL